VVTALEVAFVGVNKVVVVGIAAIVTVVEPTPIALPRPEIVQEPARLGVQFMEA
jgi:hypothetical protein